jgi:hypothetical protein
MPTEPGCRLDAATQRECWMLYFEKAFSLYVYEHEVLRRVWDDPYKQSLPKPMALLARARRLESLGIQTAPPACPILRGVMVEMGVPMEPDDIVRIDHAEQLLLEIADEWASITEEERELERLRRDDKYWLDPSLTGTATENRRRVDEVEARKQAVDARLKKLRDERLAIANARSQAVPALPHYPAQTTTIL